MIWRRCYNPSSTYLPQQAAGTKQSEPKPHSNTMADAHTIDTLAPDAHTMGTLMSKHI